MWFKGGNQKSINIKDARDEILPCSQPELWPLYTRCSWQTFLLKIIIISSWVSFQETKEHSDAPFVTKARIGVPLMINSCFLTVSSFFSTNLVPALWIVLFDWVISTYFMFCSNFVLDDVMLLSHLSNSKSKYHRQHSHRLKLYLRAWCTWNITWLSNRIPGCLWTTKKMHNTKSCFESFLFGTFLLDWKFRLTRRHFLCISFPRLVSRALLSQR